MSEDRFGAGIFNKVEEQIGPEAFQLGLDHTRVHLKVLEEVVLMQKAKKDALVTGQALVVLVSFPAIVRMWRWALGRR